MQLGFFDAHKKHHRYHSCPQPVSRFSGNKHSQRHGHQSAADESHHRRLQTAHDALDPFALPKCRIAPGNQENHHKAWQHDTQSRAQGAGNPTHLGAYKSSQVHRDGAGGGLSNGNKINQRFRGHPALVHHLLLYHSDHGVAAAEGEGTNEEKDTEQFPINHFSFLLPAARLVARPSTPHRMITRKVLTLQRTVSTKASAIST